MFAESFSCILKSPSGVHGLLYNPSARPGLPHADQRAGGPACLRQGMGPGICLPSDVLSDQVTHASIGSDEKARLIDQKNAI
jgi:hypothetical protein